MSRVCGARLPGATLGVELAATPADGCTALAAKLKSVAGAAPTDPKSDGLLVMSDDGAAASAGALEAPVSAVLGAAGLVCTWSAVTGTGWASGPESQGTLAGTFGGGGKGAPSGWPCHQ